MANTPLELYEEAYRLHYHEKKIPEAIKLYEAIIRDFPDSNECGYTVIQLQKVKANDIATALKKGATTLYPLIIVAFMSSFIALLLSIIGIIFLFQQWPLEHHRSTLATTALSKMYSGKEDEALRIIEEMKQLPGQEFLATQLQFDITSKKYSSGRTAAPAVQPPPDAVPKALTPDERPAVRPRTNTPNRRPARQNKSPFIVNPDSISYF